MEKDTNKKESRMKKFKVILDSATFALLLSLLLFSFEMINGAKETEEIVDNLTTIQNSLSTRYLGLFPEYIGSINQLLDDAVEHQGKNNVRDSIIIFEDVLYYGIRSDAKGFRRMMENLLILSNYGCHITMAYYGVDGMPFKNMVRDKLISDEHRKSYRVDHETYRQKRIEMRKMLDQLPSDMSKTDHEAALKKMIASHLNEDFVSGAYGVSLRSFMRNFNNYAYVDSVICQKYYEKSREASRRRFAANVKGYLEPLPLDTDAIDAASSKVNQLCLRLDDIKKHYLGKAVSDITYSDYYNMYKDMTMAISELLASQPNIELIPLNETLMMSCWMSIVDSRKEAIFAFPSKYSTDEIGFVSQDPNIAKYIHMMLNGVRNSHSMIQ